VLAVAYRLRRRFRARWRAALALALVVAVLGGVVLSLVAGASRTLSAPDRYGEAQGVDFGISVQQEGGRPVTEQIRALPAVAEIVAATFVFGQLVPAGAPPEQAVDGLVFAGNQLAFGTRVVEGRDAGPANPEEFVMSRSLAASAGAQLGDRFDLWVIPSGPASEKGFEAADQAAPLLTTALVGIIDGPAELQSGYGVSAVPATMLDRGDVGVSSTVSSLRLTPGSTIEDLRSQLDGLGADTQLGIDPDLSDWVSNDVRRAVSARGQGLAVMAAIGSAATVVVVGQVIGRHVRIDEQERLVLSAMGLTRREIAAEPLLAAAASVVLGTVVAVGAGWAASGWFPIGFVRHIEPDAGRRFDVLPLVGGALALALLLIGWVLAALLGGRRHGSRRRPLVVPAVARRGPVPVTTGLRFAFVRQASDPSGPLAAVVGMLLVLGVGAGALTFGASLDDLVEHRELWGDRFDVGIGGQGGEEVPAEAVATVQDRPEVEAVALLGSVLTNVGAQQFDVTGMEAVRGSGAPPVFEGRLPEGADELAVGRVAARRLSVDVGDELTVVGPAGPRTLRVTGIAVIPGADGASGVGEGGLVTFDGLRLLDPEAAPSVAAVRFRPDAPPDAAERLSADLGFTVGPPDRPDAITNVARVRAIPYVVAAILGVLAMLNLAHQLIVSTQRRRRDLAVLQALGAERRWVSAVVHWQASLFTLAVVALSVPLGLLAGRLVYRAFVDRIGALDTVALPLLGFAAALLALVVMANVVAAPNAHRARHPHRGVLTES
jgi:hypothetical protein